MEKNNRISVEHKQLKKSDVLMSLDGIRSRLLVIFKKHIGESQGIGSLEIFYQVLGENPLEMDMFKRLFWWRSIKQMLATLRHEGKLFVINHKQKWFVLQTKQEAQYFKTVLDREIRGMHQAKLKADAWVTEQKWRNI